MFELHKEAFFSEDTEHFLNPPLSHCHTYHFFSTLMRDVYLWTPPLAMDSRVRIAQWGQKFHETELYFSSI